MMVMGVPIGYSSPNTLTDKSTKIKKATRHSNAHRAHFSFQNVKNTSNKSIFVTF
jgi:hypothetical protein